MTIEQRTRYEVRKSAGHRPASMEFPEDLYERLQSRSRIEERSMAAITRHAVRDYLEHLDSFPPEDVQPLTVEKLIELLSDEDPDAHLAWISRNGNLVGVEAVSPAEGGPVVKLYAHEKLR